ncbi:Glycosyltransferase [Azospirillaceae bacterium]
MLAPIVLFVYNRPSHTQKTLEALARNTLAAQSELIIFSDAPKNEAAIDAVKAIRKMIVNLPGFASVSVVERTNNLGLAKSIISGVTEVINKFGRVIVLEDDLVTSPLFLQYMNNALDHYENDQKAFSIGGYQFPQRTMPIPEHYHHDTYASYRCCSWGWATWRDRWMRIDWSMDYFDAFITSPEQQARFNRGGPDMAQMLKHQKEGRIDSWAIRFCYAHFANDMRCIYPTQSLINNIGLDNTGVHCGVDPRREHNKLDENFLPRNFCPSHPVVQDLTSAFYQAFCPESAPPEALTPRVFLRKTRSLARILFKFAYRILRRVYKILFPQKQTIDILLVNTIQKDGGAARAAWRTFIGINRTLHHAHYLTLLKDDIRSDITGRYRLSLKGQLTARASSLDQFPLKFYPNRQSVTFTPAILANPLRIPLTRFHPRLVHLHWLASSLLRIEELGRLQVPVVWTLHDVWAFTGGCHYTGDCRGFQNQCGNCPQLGSNRDRDLSHAIWKRKQAAYAKINLTIVTPSRWLAEIAGQSSLLTGKRIEVIPNGLDTDIFHPLEKTSAKAFLNLDPIRPVIVFGAQWLTDRRKGGDLLAAALIHIDFPCTVLMFGEGSLMLDSNPNLTIHTLGNMHDEISLAVIYSAADVFVCPSREDNLPNTVAEAMACGTPCAAFAVNGLPDMITHQTNGWLAKAFDPIDLASGIRWLIEHSQPDSLRQSAREKALAEYSLKTMSSRYSALYTELLSNSL